MKQIHPAWLQPMPSWYAAWDFRDAPQLDPDFLVPGSPPETGSPRPCAICDIEFIPDSPQANHRRVCYSLECEKERKRRNARLSARRVAARKRAQQA